MPKQIVTNNFIKGVNSDINEASLESAYLRDANNVEITKEGNQLILQKVNGIKEVVNGYDEGLTPLAAKEFDDVIYFVSARRGATPEVDEVELGTYPSLNIPAEGMLTVKSTDVSMVELPALTGEFSADTYTVSSMISDIPIRVNNTSAVKMSAVVIIEGADGIGDGASPKIGEEVIIDAGSYVDVNVRSCANLSREDHNIHLILTGREINGDIVPTDAPYKLDSAVLTVEEDTNLIYAEKYKGTDLLSYQLLHPGAVDGPVFELSLPGLGLAAGSTVNVYVYDDSGTILGSWAETVDDSQEGLHSISHNFNINGASTYQLAVAATYAVLDKPPGLTVYFTFESFTVTGGFTGDMDIKRILVRLNDNSGAGAGNVEEEWPACTPLSSLNDIEYTDTINIKDIEVTINDGSFTQDRFLVVNMTGAAPTPAEGIGVRTQLGVQCITTLPVTTTAVTFKADQPVVNSFVFSITNTAARTLSCSGVYDTGNEFDIALQYGALKNYKSDYSSNPYDYIDDFRTAEFGYDRNSNVTLELQQTYDDTINMIMTDGESPVRIVNSRTLFYTNSDGTRGELVVRNGDNLSNVYSNDTIDSTKLIPYVGNIIVDAEFKGVRPGGGALPGGGYKYFFKLVTVDGAETDVVAESGLVSVHNGSKYGKAFYAKDGVVTNNAVEFQLSGITNKAFRFVRTYFTVSTGQTDTPAVQIFKIDKDFEVDINTGICNITHSGYENQTQSPLDTVIQGLSPIETAKTLSQKNNRLLLGNTVVKNMQTDILLEQALKCYVSTTNSVSSALYVSQPIEGAPSITDKTYADPDMIYNYVSYMPGETYEFGINFVFDSGAISETYPTQGLDFTRGDVYDISRFGVYSDEFDPTTGQNSKGVVRTANREVKQLTYPKDKVLIPILEIDTTEMDSAILKAANVVSYFFSRKRRSPDLISQGLLTSTTAVSNTTAMNVETGIYTGGNYCGLKDDKHAKVYVPAPMHAVPFSIEKTEKEKEYDTVLMAPDALQATTTKFAYYAPNVAIDKAGAASTFASTHDVSAAVHLDDYHEVTRTRTAKASNGGLLPYVFRMDNTMDNTGYTTEDSIALQNIKLKVLSDARKGFAENDFTARSDRLFGLHIKEDGAFKGDNQIPRDKFEDIVAVRKVFDDDDTKGYRYMVSNVAYAPYLGITLPEVNTDINTKLTYTGEKFSSIIEPTSGNTQEEDLAELCENNLLGLFTKLYSNSYGTILPATLWERRYNGSLSGEYFCISKRYSATDLDEKTVFGGDNYVGFYYQQVWRPGGIEGLPTATSPAAYAEDRRGTGLVSTGLSIAFPVAWSSINFAIRGYEEGDAVEKNMYGDNRPYVCYENADTLRGHKRPEPSIINYGNIINESVNNKATYDQTVPFIKLTQKNRVYVSNANITSSFENGYRQFKGINFRDYDSELGEITAISSHGLHTYLVYENGVSVIEVMERAMMPTADGNNVYIANAHVLPEKSTNVLAFIGSRHSKSVISTDYGVTGVDANKRRIWSISGTEANVISESTVQNIIDGWFDNLTDVITSYNRLTKEVTYTFIRENADDVAIVYNQKMKIWYGTTFTVPLYQFILNKDKYILRKATDTHFRLFKPVLDEYSVEILENGDRTPYEAYFDYVIKNGNFSKFTLDTMTVVSDAVPNKFTVTPEELESYDVVGRALCDDTRVHIPCYTNSYIPLRGKDEPVLVDYDAADAYAVIATISAGKRMPKVGDKIMLDLSTNCVDKMMYYQYTVVSVHETGAPEKYKIVLNIPPKVSTTINNLFYGWKIPLRLSLMENYVGTTKISVPTKIQADRLRGMSPDMGNYTKRQASIRPSGKFVKVRMYFAGIAPAAVSAVHSQIDDIYS